MTSPFKLKNVKTVYEKRPVMSALMGLFIVVNAVMLLQLVASDVVKHPMYVILKGLIFVVGSMIWLNGLKSGNLGQTFLKYVGFIFIASIVQFFAYVGSYGSTTTTQTNM